VVATIEVPAASAVDSGPPPSPNVTSPHRPSSRVAETDRAGEPATASGAGTAADAGRRHPRKTSTAATEAAERRADSRRRLADLIADDLTITADDTAGTQSTDIDVEALLECLSSREREVVMDIFGLNDGVVRTVSDVAAHRGVRPDLVSRAARSALTKMRAATDKQPMIAS
jgi:DNA-directed RNA polymerase specialized sigma24 family protein